MEFNRTGGKALLLEPSFQHHLSLPMLPNPQIQLTTLTDLLSRLDDNSAGSDVGRRDT